MRHELPILGICASGSNAGKTTLITQLIPELKKSGVRVSVIKHAHYKFDIDHPGKDSYQIRESGAVQTLIASSKRWALMTESKEIGEESKAPELKDLIKNIDANFADLILVEGFKLATIVKIEVYRPSLNMPLLASNDNNIIAVASDEAINSSAGIQIPVLALDNIEQIANFILKQFIL